MKNFVINMGRKIDAYIRAPKKSHVQVLLFVLGVTALVASSADVAFALQGEDKLCKAITIIGQAITGTLGALVMVATGVGVVITAAMGNYRTAWSLLVVALGALILRGAVEAFFNVDQNCANF